MIEIIGWFAVILFGSLATIGILTYLKVIIDNFLETRTKVVAKSIREYLRLKLINDSWWFSEDEPTMNLIQELAGENDLSSIRERWRAARKKKEVTN